MEDDALLEDDAGLLEETDTLVVELAETTVEEDEGRPLLDCTDAEDELGDNFELELPALQ